MVLLRNGRIINTVLPEVKLAKECSICFNPLKQSNYVLLNCEHSFCPSCIFAWFIKDLSCPLCRRKAESFHSRIDKPLQIESNAFRKAKRDIKNISMLFLLIFCITHTTKLKTTYQMIHFIINILLAIGMAAILHIARYYY